MGPKSEERRRSSTGSKPAADAPGFELDGVTVLNGFFDPVPLSREVDASLAIGCRQEGPTGSGVAGNAFRYVPMMCERTPASLALVDALVGPARDLLGREVLPVRAKGVEYFGGTTWHRDLELDLASIGFACYLEPLSAPSGALRVIKGSHQTTPVEVPHGTPDERNAHQGDAVETEPGDVLVFDEHLWHSSIGGQVRRQWRIDVICNPDTSEEEALAREYLAQIFRVGWDGGYDVDRYPSYGRSLQDAGIGWVERLRELGALELAEREEEFVRSR